VTKSLDTYLNSIEKDDESAIKLFVVAILCSSKNWEWLNKFASSCVSLDTWIHRRTTNGSDDGSQVSTDPIQGSVPDSANLCDIQPLRISRLHEHPTVANPCSPIEELPSIASDEDSDSAPNRNPPSKSDQAWMRESRLFTQLDAQGTVDPVAVFGPFRRVTMYPDIGDTHPEMTPDLRPDTTQPPRVVSAAALSQTNSRPKRRKSVKGPTKPLGLNGDPKRRPGIQKKPQNLAKLPPRRGVRTVAKLSVLSAPPPASTKQQIIDSYRDFPDIPICTGHVLGETFDPYRVDGKFVAAILRPAVCAKIIESAKKICSQLPLNLDDGQLEVGLRSAETGVEDIVNSASRATTFIEITRIMDSRLKRNEGERVVIEFFLFCAIRVHRYVTLDPLKAHCDPDDMLQISC
jgi:Inner centromere protein, ARK binding region